MNSPRTLFRESAEAALGGTTVVTPHELAARALRHACELRIARTDKPTHTPRVLSWGAFLAWLWREALMIGAVDRILLSREQQRVLWEQTIAESPAGARLINLAGAAARAREAWELIHACAVPFPSALFDRAPETKAFAGWAAEYARLCARNGWTEPARAVDELTAIAPALKQTLPSLAAYGFDDCTPQQGAFFQALRGAGISVEQRTFVQQLRLDGSLECDHVRQIATNDAEDELRRAATWARNRLKAKPSALIGIIVPRLHELRSAVEHVFAEVLHPESFFVEHAPAQRVFELSLGGSVAEQGLVDTALRALRFASAPLPLEESCRLVRSPYTSGADDERGSRAAFDLVLRRTKSPRITPAELLSEARKARCNALSKQLAAFVGACAPFAQQHPPSKWAQHISAALTELGWPGPLDPAEYQAHEAFVELLRRFSAIEVVRPAKISAQQAVYELTRLCRDQAFHRKSTNAPVQVLGTVEAAGAVFEHLWICGMTDDAWPPRGTANPFIPFALQAKHELPHSSPQRDNEFAARQLSRLYASATEVIVSWPKRDKESELRPAPQIADIAIASPEICDPLAPSIASFVPAAELEIFTDETAPAASPGLQQGGIKLFEFQSLCPFRAFAEKRLIARQVESAYAGPSYIERGKIIETVLQRAWSEFGNGRHLQQLSGTPEFHAVLERAVEGAIRECIPQPGRWFDNYRVVERARLLQIAQNWFEMELQRSPFDGVVHQHEVEIHVCDIAVRGYIDRIDQLPSGDVAVIDYKSGDKYSARSWELPRMEAPQLPLYAIAQQPGTVSAVAFGIARTDRCELSGYARNKDILARSSSACERDMTHEIDTWRGELELLARAYLAGDAAVNPKSENKTCKWCHLGPLCRVKQQSGPEARDDI